MALELAGLAIAILSLSKDCIEILSYVSVAKSFGHDYYLLNTKFDLEKAHLVRWAERIRLATPDYDRRLDDPAIGQPILHAMTAIRDLFNDASVLKNRYGLQESEKAAAISDDFSISAKRVFSFHEQFKELSISTRQEVARRSVLKKVRWTIHDKAKFETLIADLSYFTTRISDLMPDKSDLIGRMIDEDFVGLRQVKQSRVLLDAAAGQGDVVKGPAATRHERNCEKRIVNQLWFRSMNDRPDRIDCPYPETFEWPLDPPPWVSGWSDLPSWLREGSGVYWISGKAAAGKSTLMKHILNHPRSRQYLNEWANGVNLTIASFFFLVPWDGRSEVAYGPVKGTSLQYT